MEELKKLREENENLKNQVSDLIIEIQSLEETLKDLMDDIEQNYRQITREEELI